MSEDEKKGRRGGARTPGPGKRLGRPPRAEPAAPRRMLNVRISEAQEAAYHATARAAGKTVAAWVKDLLDAAALPASARSRDEVS